MTTEVHELLTGAAKTKIHTAKSINETKIKTINGSVAATLQMLHDLQTTYLMQQYKLLISYCTN